MALGTMFFHFGPWKNSTRQKETWLPQKWSPAECLLSMNDSPNLLLHTLALFINSLWLSCCISEVFLLSVSYSCICFMFIYFLLFYYVLAEAVAIVLLKLFVAMSFKVAICEENVLFWFTTFCPLALLKLVALIVLCSVPSLADICTLCDSPEVPIW